MTRRPALILSLLLTAAGVAALAAPATQPAASPWSLLSNAVGTDGLQLVTYRTAAVAPGTPCPATSAPAGYQWWPSPGPVWAAASNRWVAQFRAAPAPAPVAPPATRAAIPATAPALPPVSRYVNATGAVASTPPASYLVSRTTDQTLADLHVEGFNFGAVCQNFKGGLTIRNCRFVDSYSDAQLQGSAVYASAIPGPIVVTDTLFSRPGRPRSQPDYTPTLFRHCWYGQGDAAAPLFTRCIFDGAANAGAQFRNGGKCAGCLLDDNGVNVLAVMGDVELDDCLILSAHLTWDGSAWTGGTAVQAYNPIRMNRCLIVGTVGQCSTPPANTHPGAKLYPQPCVVTGGAWANNDHPPFVAPAPGVPLITGAGNVIAGWTAGVPIFGGARPHSGAGFAVYPNPVTYDPTPVIDAVRANRISVPDAIARVRADVAALVTKANPGAVLPN